LKRCGKRRTGSLVESEAWEFVAKIRREAYDALNVIEKPGCGLLFAQAVTRYAKRHPILEDGRRCDNNKYLERIVREIGLLPVEDVDQHVVDELAEKLYPGRTAATLNRQVYTPIMSVLNDLIKSKKIKGFVLPRIERPKKWLAKSNFVRPPDDWWAKVFPHCPPNLKAFLLFCTIHGRRTSEACRLTPTDINTRTWRVCIKDTKCEQDIILELARPVIEALNGYVWRGQQYVFGFSSKSKVYPALRAACKMAGVPYSRPKDNGRHMAATRMLEEGHTLQEVKEAFRWKTIQMPSLHYGHIEINKVDANARAVGESWTKKQFELA